MIAYTNYKSDARVRREAETLSSLNDFEVSVLVLKEQKKHRSYLLDGVKVVEISIKKYRGKSAFRYLLSYFSFLVGALIACSRLFLSGKADVVHVHNMPDFLVFSAILPKLFGSKIILDIHDSLPETFTVKFKRRMGKGLFRILCWEEILCSKFADKIICVNHVQKEAVISRGVEAKKIQVLLNVPDPQKFSSQSKNRDTNQNQRNFKLVYHGTLTKRLGVDLAIRAVARLLHSIPELEFFILGEGDDMDELIDLSNSLGLNGSIHFNKKMMPVEQLAEVLSGMHLGLISNRKNMATELMLPVKMLEYVALDIPVAVPELKGIKHYFSPDMVRYFIPENVDSMASAIEDLYRHKNKRAEQASRAKTFLDRFGWDKHKFKLINLYETL